jgi:ribosomal protein L29
MSKVQEYRDLSAEKLQTKVDDSKRRLAKLINQQVTDPGDDVREKRNLKRNIARMMTVLNEKQGDA